MYAPHVVTLYNVSEDPDTLELVYNITILSGVFLERAQGTNIAKTGLRDADSVRLFIPFSVTAIDGNSGERKQYIGPKAYRRLGSTEGYWTLDPGGASSGSDCFFVKGIIISNDGYRALRNSYDDVYDVTTIDVRDFGSEDMQHWQVGGN